MAGTTFSFYSYKGGVGRSMALANLAVLFYRRPLDVVVVDWDLEAPGIERYLADRYPPARSKMIEHRPGLCDLIQEYRDRLAEPPEPGEEPISPYPDLDDYLVTVDSQHDCSLRVLTAGDRTDWGRYARFVQSFNWTDFYANWGGGGFFEWLRESLADLCDLVLVDTRTGVTEMGGVATRQMADVIVILFAGNEENMASSARMAKNFLSGDPSDRNGRPLSVMLVPSRIDDSDSTEFAEFHSRLAQLGTISADPPDGYRLQDLILPYRALLAFREQLVLGNEHLETVLSPLLEGYQRIAANMQQLAPELSRLRRGTGVTHGRVFLLSRPHQEATEAEIRHTLVQNDFEVLPTVPGTEPEEAELAGSTCVLVLLDEQTAKSRRLAAVLGYADRLAKPVIPVLLDAHVSPPLSLADIVPLDWWDTASRSRDHLLRSVRATSTEPTAPTTSDQDAVQAGSDRRVFISYSHKDREIAARVADQLTESGLATWLDVEQLNAGDSWTGQSQMALNRSDAVVVLVSPALLGNRQSLQEISYAQRVGVPVIPVRVGKVGDRDLPLDLARLQMVDATDQPLEAAVEAIARWIRTRPTG